MAPTSIADQTDFEPSWEDLSLPMAPDNGSGGLETAMQQLSNQNVPPPWSPGNPLFWVLAFLAGATGLIFVSTHVKVGRLKASIET